MQWLGIVIFVILACFVTWLLVDTIIYVIKRVKEKKRAKRGDLRLDNGEKVIDNDTTDDYE